LTKPLERYCEKSAWYGARAWDNRYRYVLLKSIEIALAGSIILVAVGLPAIAGALPEVGTLLMIFAHEAGLASAEAERWGVAVLAVSIVALEWILHARQYQDRWLLFRAVRDALKREDLLYATKAGCYAMVADAEQLFVERCDSIIALSPSPTLADRGKRQHVDQRAH
jgi:hypothetical protein